jgi:hypothetical protein
MWVSSHDQNSMFDGKQLLIKVFYLKIFFHCLDFVAKFPQYIEMLSSWLDEDGKNSGKLSFKMGK